VGDSCHGGWSGFKLASRTLGACFVLGELHPQFGTFAGNISLMQVEKRPTDFVFLSCQNSTDEELCEKLPVYILELGEALGVTSIRRASTA
jgi:hypothetical protein